METFFLVSQPFWNILDSVLDKIKIIRAEPSNLELQLPSRHMIDVFALCWSTSAALTAALS